MRSRATGQARSPWCCALIQISVSIVGIDPVRSAAPGVILILLTHHASACR